MKKILMIFILTFTFLTKMNAQYFWGASYTPNNCTINDSITILDTFDVEPSVAGSRTAYYMQYNDTILITECFPKPGLFTTSVTLSRETKIGKLSAGQYTVIVRGIFRGTTCSNIIDTFRNKIVFPLKVLEYPSNIIEHDKISSQTKISFNDNFIMATDIPKNSSLTIYDIDGRLVSKNLNCEKAVNIDTDNWLTGVYFISIESNGYPRRYRVFIE